VLIVADGDVDAALLIALAGSARVAADRPLVIAADGGAARCLAARVRPDLVVGDFDSLADADRDRLVELDVPLRSASPDKDESDMELCVLAALELGAERITILGALGDERPEHSLANVLLLADPRLDGRGVAIVGRGARLIRLGTAEGPGEAVIDGEAGDYVSLLPLAGEVAGVTTDGLRFPLHDEALPVGPARGLSNELLQRRARVTTRRGRLLLVHTPRPATSPPSGRSNDQPAAQEPERR
jgi:thiamine pyrophosphokinase